MRRNCQPANLVSSPTTDVDVGVAVEADRLERIAAVQRELGALASPTRLTPRANRARRTGSTVSAVFTDQLEETVAELRDLVP